MTFSKIDFSLLTFSVEQVRAMGDLFFSEYILGGQFSQYHRIFPGVKYGREVGLIGELGLVGKAAQGCSPTPDVKSLAVTKKQWAPGTMETLIELCISDMETNLSLYSLKLGPDAPDLTGTDYLNVFIETLQKAWNKAYWRIWLMDKDAAHSDDSPAGVITPSVSLDYFDLVDGYWKQVYAIVATTPARKVAVAANAQVTYALQDSALTAQLAWEYLLAVTYNATSALKQHPKSDCIFYATRSLVDKAKQYLQDKSVINTYLNMVNGIETLNVNGYLCQAIDIWDEQIRAYEDNGTYWNKPHRAYLGLRDHLMLGTPSSGMIEMINAYYDPKTRTTNLEARDGISPLILQDDLIQVAY